MDFAPPNEREKPTFPGERLLVCLLVRQLHLPDLSLGKVFAASPLHVALELFDSREGRISRRLIFPRVNFSRANQHDFLHVSPGKVLSGLTLFHRQRMCQIS